MTAVMTLKLNVAEVNLVNQLVRNSRELAARFTSSARGPCTMPVHDSVIVKCEQALDDLVRKEVARHERQNREK